MLYLHVLDSSYSDEVKSMFVEDVDAYKLGKLISISEPNNLVIINSIEIDRETLNKRIVKILHVFINGTEDGNYTEALKVKRK